MRMPLAQIKLRSEFQDLVKNLKFSNIFASLNILLYESDLKRLPKFYLQIFLKEDHVGWNRF
jgi:hypothetical protein